MASGTYVIDIITPAGNTVDQGTYTKSGDGTWTQASSTLGFQFLGMVTILGGTLTVDVTQPAAAANTTVWQRRRPFGRAGSLCGSEAFGSPST